MSVARSVLQGDPAIWTILVAAGEGSRFGGPKQLQPLGGRRVIDWALGTAAGASHGVVVVAAANQVQLLREGPGALTAAPRRPADSRSGGPLPEPEAGAGGSADTAPADTAPADTAPADTAPADTAPADPAPADPAPADPAPADPAPADPDPADGFPRIIVTAGGATRSESVRAGIAAIPNESEADVIVVHDAARPLATGALFSAVTAAVAEGADGADGADGAVPAVPVTDTIRHADDGPLDRSRLRAVQTPQAFRAAALRRAHRGAPEATDDATLVEAAGGSVLLVDGDPDNVKITTPGDLEVAEALLAARSGTATHPGNAGEAIARGDWQAVKESGTATHPGNAGDAPAPARNLAGQECTDAPADRGPAAQQARAHAESEGGHPDTPIGIPLVGIGFDVHPFSDDPERPLVLGGVRFEGERGLAGHSDADAVAHACCDAILGIASLGDIGSLFPDDDDRWRNADSIALLAEAAERVRRTGRRIGNIDCTVVAERPKLAPRRAEMQARLSAAAGASVTVRGKRAESLGAVGRGEGIACWAVAVLF